MPKFRKSPTLQKITKQAKSTTSVTASSKSQESSEWMYYQSKQIAHDCEHQDDTDDLYALYPGKSLFRIIARGFHGFFICSHTKRALTFFRSHACIDYERSRQLRLHPYMIHPFSKFKVFWEVIFSVMLSVSVILNAYLYAFPRYRFHVLNRSYIVYTVRVSDVFCTVDVLTQFITGKLRRDVRKVELQFKSIAKRYLKTYFILDVITTVPVVYIYLVIENFQPYYKSVYFYGFAMMFLRLVRTVPYILNSCAVLNVSHDRQMYILVGIGMVYYFHLNACFVFFVSTYFEAGNEYSWLQESRLFELKYPIEIYDVSVNRVIFTTLGLCLRFTPENLTDQLTTMFFMVTGIIGFLFLVGKNFQLTRARKSSLSMYEAMITQVNQYMASRKLPKRLQNRVIEFYHFRFHRSFYNETRIMAGISRQLRQDYMFHQCQSLVSKVAFFSELPTHVLVRIVTALKVEFCLDSETVIRHNTSGTAMYFIRSGTVAVYAASGKEVCHLEDGNHFGEIALVLSNFRRVASIVTIENCEFYRLERDDFNAVMSHFPEYLSKVRNVAMRRLEKAMRMESQYFENLEEYIKANTIQEKNTDKVEDDETN